MNSADLTGGTQLVDGRPGIVTDLHVPAMCFFITKVLPDFSSTSQNLFVITSNLTSDLFFLIFIWYAVQK